MNTPPAAARAAVVEALLEAAFVKATFAGPPRSGVGPARVTVRPVDLRGTRTLQFAAFDGKRTTTTQPADARAAVTALAALDYAGVNVVTTAGTLDVRFTKKGKAFVGRGTQQAPPADLRHNRTKDQPRPDGTPDSLLQLLGIQDESGRVKPTMRAKFTQVNEFLTHLGHGLMAAGLPEPGRELRVLDCGSGASYLTLVAHHELAVKRGIPTAVVGIEANADLVAKSTARAAAAGADVVFRVGRIADWSEPADVVLALHACDTATDDALVCAVRGGAKLILSVPCCHHHLNAQLSSDGPLRAVTRHGLLRQRTADIVTDALRAAALRAKGYKVDVVEFVTAEHTARNLMIRAAFTGVPSAEAADEFRELCRFWNVVPYLADRLGPDSAGYATPLPTGSHE